MIIDVIIPSHRRAWRIREMVSYWLNNAQEPENIIIWVACEKEDKNSYKEALKGLDGLELLPADYGCWVNAINAIAKKSKGEVIIASADDVRPNQFYDAKIRDLFRVKFPGLDGVIRADDGLQGINETSNPHPIVGRKYYEAFGYIFYPGYFALWADHELAVVSQKLDRVERCGDILLEHLHHSKGLSPRDYTHEKPLSQNPSGEQLFKRREVEGFPIFKNGKFSYPEEVFV